MKKNRYKVDRIFILGAGASRCASTDKRKTPLDSEFCEELYKLDLQIPLWVPKSRDIVCNSWNYPTEFFDMKLEQVVLKQVSHYEFIDAIHPRKRQTTIDSVKYLNHVSHLITFLLRRARENSRKLYKSFSSSVFPHDDVSRNTDRIITFNYDDLLDKYLINRFSKQEIYFDRFKESRYDSYYRNEAFDSPLLIKMHGSVNWRCETSNFEKVIDSKKRDPETNDFINIWYSEKGTPLPSDSVSPLIIPPLPSKPITSIGIFKYLWTKAYEYLHEAKELIICGYSLPVTDQLAFSMFSNFSNRGIEKVTIVDPDTEVLGRWREVLTRNNVEIQQWIWVSDFEEYLDSC